MKWLKRLYQKYTRGAKANKFSISIYGLFERRLQNPHNLDEAIGALGCLLSPEERINVQEWTENHFVAIAHHTIGRWIRNNWGLWSGKSNLFKWFKAKGLFHPDDMSGVILTSYWRVKNNKPIKFNEQIQSYLQYWQQSKERKNGKMQMDL